MKKQLYVNGDSLAVGTMWFLPGLLPDWTINAQTKVGKSTSTGVSEMKSHFWNEDILFINLGTNDNPSQVETFWDNVHDVLAMVKDKPIIWSNIHRPPVDRKSYDDFNRFLHHTQRNHPNFHVYYWHRAARRHPEWFGADGIHPNVTGYRARAHAIANLIETLA